MKVLPLLEHSSVHLHTIIPYNAQTLFINAQMSGPWFLLRCPCFCNRTSGKSFFNLAARIVLFKINLYKYSLQGFSLGDPTFNRPPTNNFTKTYDELVESLLYKLQLSAGVNMETCRLRERGLSTFTTDFKCKRSPCAAQCLILATQNPILGW